MSGPRSSTAAALALLGLPGDADAPARAAAFRAAVKACHPDHGGDGERLRLVVEAYRLLQAAPPPPVQPTAPLAPVVRRMEIDPARALADGLRPGDLVRVDGLAHVVAVRSEGGVSVVGDHLYVTLAVSAALLAEGGRIAVDTPHGPRMVWAPRDAGRRLIRIEGCGLPANADRPQGCMFLRLKPEVRAFETASSARRRQFRAAWAA